MPRFYCHETADGPVTVQPIIDSDAVVVLLGGPTGPSIHFDDVDEAHRAMTEAAVQLRLLRQRRTRLIPEPTDGEAIDDPTDEDVELDRAHALADAEDLKAAS